MTAGSQAVRENGSGERALWSWSGWLLIAASSVLVMYVQRSSPRIDRFDLHIYYNAIRSRSMYDYRVGGRGYGWVYPPFTALVIWPFTWLQFRTTEIFWTAISVAAAVWTLRLALRQTMLAVRFHWFIPVGISGLLWTSPIQSTLKLGQINLWIAALVVTDFLAAAEGRRHAGYLIGIAAALKFTPAIVLLALVDRRFLGVWKRAAAAFGACVALGFAVLPHDSWRYWTKDLYGLGRTDHPTSSVNNSLGRIAALLKPPTGLGHIAIVVASLVLVIVAWRRAATAMQRNNPLAALVIASVCGYAISPVTWSHHLLLLVVAPVVVVGTARNPVRVLGGLGLLIAMIEFENVGQIHGYVNVRAVLIPIVVCCMPIDSRSTRDGTSERHEQAAVL